MLVSSAVELPSTCAESRNMTVLVQVDALVYPQGRVSDDQDPLSDQSEDEWMGTVQ
jgi:hypothetical protein